VTVLVIEKTLNTFPFPSKESTAVLDLPSDVLTYSYTARGSQPLNLGRLPLHSPVFSVSPKDRYPFFLLLEIFPIPQFFSPPYSRLPLCGMTGSILFLLPTFI